MGLFQLPLPAKTAYSYRVTTRFFFPVSYNYHIRNGRKVSDLSGWYDQRLLLPPGTYGNFGENSPPGASAASTSASQLTFLLL